MPWFLKWWLSTPRSGPRVVCTLGQPQPTTTWVPLHRSLDVPQAGTFRPGNVMGGAQQPLGSDVRFGRHHFCQDSVGETTGA